MSKDPEEKREEELRLAYVVPFASVRRHFEPLSAQNQQANKADREDEAEERGAGVPDFPRRGDEKRAALVVDVCARLASPMSTDPTFEARTQVRCASPPRR